jgi:1-acyl-sn-glycerol-3-phosphate acyltransferase
MIEYDDAVGSKGLPAGGMNLVERYVREFRVFGRENIPAGAFLALSNHPGMTDTVALFAALDRKDLHIIALDRPFLNALPNTTRQLFYVYDEPVKRMSMVRQVSSHLRSGKPMLTFPAGHIEPDPDIHQDSIESLATWTDSVGVFLRMAPETPVLPVLVRGVVSRRAATHWLLNLKRTKDEKEKLAAALQLLGMVMFAQRPVRVRVQIGRPIYAKQLGSTDTQVIHQAVLAEMKHLIENPPA